jgi:hypothetical protein
LVPFDLKNGGGASPGLRSGSALSAKSISDAPDSWFQPIHQFRCGLATQAGV